MYSWSFSLAPPLLFRSSVSVLPVRWIDSRRIRLVFDPNSWVHARCPLLPALSSVRASRTMETRPRATRGLINRTLGTSPPSSNLSPTHLAALLTTLRTPLSLSCSASSRSRRSLDDVSTIVSPESGSIRRIVSPRKKGVHVGRGESQCTR